jgi:hypothetical protein
MAGRIAVVLLTQRPLRAGSQWQPEGVGAHLTAGEQDGSRCPWYLCPCVLLPPCSLRVGAIPRFGEGRPSPCSFGPKQRSSQQQRRPKRTHTHARRTDSRGHTE